MIDYHVHTPLCNHAEGRMEDYVRHAVAKGFIEICFLDHLTLNPKGSRLSMGPEDVALYYYAARRLRKKFAGKIEVKVGLEVDFTPSCMERAEEIVNRFSFDVIGGSIHFVDDTDIVSTRKTASRTSGEDEVIYARYLELIEKMSDYSCFDVICHPDLPKKFGKQLPDWFYEKMDAILARIGYKGIVFEINTSGLVHPAKSVYPDPIILKQCIENNIPVTIGSDAHRPEHVGRNFDSAVSVLKSAGYRHITGFARRSRYEIPITNRAEPDLREEPN